MITCKVIRVGSPIVEVALDDGATAGEALEAANISLSSGEGVTVNGNPAGLDDEVNEGDRVIVAKGAKSA